MYRTAHGQAKKYGALAVIETAKPSELPGGVPGVPRPVPTRDSSGRFTKSLQTQQASREAGSKGGKAKSQALSLARMCGFAELGEEHPFRPYQKLMAQYQAQHTEAIALSVGGGTLSPGVVALIANAARFQAVSLFLHDQAVMTSTPALFVSSGVMADRSRTALLTAFEMAIKEAHSRPSTYSKTDAIIASFSSK